MNDKQPEVSVIMGIYNCENTLAQCIESILNQTYENWELIICDDCSTDNTFNIALEYANLHPNKIRLIKNDKNLTLAPTLNKCLEYVNGKYIARQDGDDFSHKDRLYEQVKFLEDNEMYDLVGTGMISFNENGIVGEHKLKKNPTKEDMAYGVTFAHATVLIKTEVIKQLKGYCEENYAKQLEDYELWSRFFLNGYKGYNIQESFYYVREDDNSYKRRNIKRRLRGIKLRLIVAKRLKFNIKGYVLGLKDVFALFVPNKVFENYYKLRLKNNIEG